MDRDTRIEELFHAALERDPAERKAFVDTACGSDDDLRHEVETLLDALDEAPDLPDRPAWAPLIDETGREGSSDRDAECEPGLPFERLGEFRLVRKLGEGGMGAVYLAIQESLGRKVALKVIRADRAGSFEAESRFRREIDAISALRHPSLVTIHGSGEAEGVRYFAMEYVPGRGFDELLAAARHKGVRIPTPRIVAWVKAVAGALDAAHQAGIIHRDVKPSNIRIRPDDEPMLFDFGVARHMNLSTLTLTGDFRGTPHYSSPEQVRAERGTIDSRTDVYSLGVCAYEALTGRTPFEGETTAQVFHQILDKDPPLPRALNPAISRDLETVIVTAMDKDPHRRYQSMEAFGGDLQRILDGEMILAKPAGLATKAWKRVKRNPVSTTAAATAFLAAIGFVSYVLLWSYPQIRAERNEAQFQREAAVREAEKVLAVNKYLEEMLSSANPETGDRNVKVLTVVDRQVDRIDHAFPDQPEVEASLRTTMGQTYMSLGEWAKAEKQYRAALEIRQRILGDDHRDTLSSTSNLANSLGKLGRADEAERLYEAVLEKERRILGHDDPGTILTECNRAIFLADQGRLAEAEEGLRAVLEKERRVLGDRHPDTVEAMGALAVVLTKRQKLAEAETLQRETLEKQRENLGDDHPETLSSLANLAAILISRNELAMAEPLQREVLIKKEHVLGDDHPDTISAKHNLASLLFKQGKLDDAKRLFGEVLDARERVLGEERIETLSTMDNYAFVLLTMGNFAEAESIARRSLEIEERVLGREHPTTVATMEGLALILLQQGKLDEADRFFAESVKRVRTLEPLNRDQVARFCLHHGSCLAQLKRYDEAERLLLESYENFKATWGKDHERTRGPIRFLIDLNRSLGRTEKVAHFEALLQGEAVREDGEDSSGK